MYSLYINDPIEFQVDVINRLFNFASKKQQIPRSNQLTCKLSNKNIENYSIRKYYKTKEHQEKLISEGINTSSLAV
jgi:hypothetical protein